MVSPAALYAQDPSEYGVPEQAGGGETTGDIILDYRGLVHKIDEMRTREEDLLRRFEDLSRGYEENLKRLEDLVRKLESDVKDFENKHERAIDKLKDIDRAWTQPSEVKGEIRGVPSDRYTTR